MNTDPLPGGTVHTLPPELHKLITSNAALPTLWLSLTPLARNEWICWTTSAKHESTNEKRRGRMQQELLDGMRRPCCWPGCPHREKTGRL